MHKNSEEGGGHGWGELIALSGDAKRQFLDDIGVVLGGDGANNHTRLDRARCPKVKKVEEGTIAEGKGDLYSVPFFHPSQFWELYTDHIENMDLMLKLQRKTTAWTHNGKCGYEEYAECEMPEAIY